MHLLKSDQTGNPKNTLYSDLVKITNVSELIEAVKYDHVGVVLKEGERKNENFLGSDCVMIDVDNQLVDTADQYTIAAFLHDFRRYKAFVVESKSHNKEKHGEVRERFHVFFPIKTTKDVAEYSKIKKILATKCHNDGDSLDVSRFFFGIENPVVYQTKGRQLITDAPFLRKKEREKGVVVKVKAGAGLGKSMLVMHLASVLHCKCGSSTWKSSRRIGRSTIYQEAGGVKSLTGKRQKYDWIIVDEAGMAHHDKVVKMILANPYRNFLIVGDPNQMTFGDPSGAIIKNALDAQAELEIRLTNELNPRITDFRLRTMLDGLLKEGSWDFEMFRHVFKTLEVGVPRCQVIADTNEACEIINSKHVFLEPGCTIKARVNETRWSMNDFFKVVENNDITTKLTAEDGRTFVVPTRELRNTHYDEHEQRFVPDFVLAEANTAHSVQSLTLDAVCIDVGSLVRTVKNPKSKNFGKKFVDRDRAIRFLYTAMSRVRTLEGLTFLNVDEFLNTPVKGTWKADCLKADVELDSNSGSTMTADEWNAFVKKHSKRETARTSDFVDEVHTSETTTQPKDEFCDTFEAPILDSNCVITVSQASAPIYSCSVTALAVNSTINESSSSTIDRSSISDVMSVPVADFCPSSFISERAYVDAALEFITYSKGHRNEALCNLSRKLRSKHAKDPSFDEQAAFAYAQSIIGCAEYESIRRRVLNGNG
jgi:hypothetical protein